MHDSDRIPNTGCSTTLNEFTCKPTYTLFYINVASLTIIVIACVLLLFVLYYRRHHKLSSFPFRYINGYYVPKPVDILILCIIVGLLIRIIRYSIILAGPPQSVLFYYIINSSLTAVVMLTGILAVTGIMSHIPTIFVRQSHAQHSNSNGNCANAVHICASARQPVTRGNHTLCVPTIRGLTFINVYFSFFSIVPTITLGALVGWAEETDQIAIAAILRYCYYVYSTVFELTITLATLYYCYGFYCILKLYASRETYKPHDVQEERQAAKSFQNIFIALLVLKAVIWFITVPISIISDYLTQFPWLYIALLILQYCIIYPGVQLVIGFNLFKNSRIQVQRQMTTCVAAMERIDPQLMTIIDYLQSESNHPRLTTTIHRDKLCDSSLVWHTFAANSFINTNNSTSSPATTEPSDSILETITDDKITIN